MAITQNEARSKYLINQIAREIGAIVGHDQVSSDKAKRIEQASDWSWMSKYLLSKNEELPIADLVVSPKSTEEVSKVVAIANEYRMPIIPRGGGSGTQSGTFALYGGIALDLKRLNTEAEFAKTLVRKFPIVNQTVPQQTYTLQPNSRLYIIPFPLNVLRMNPSLTLNTDEKIPF